jgi:predicted nucleic acid-binding protein
MIFDVSVLIAALAGESRAKAALSGCANPKISVASRAELLALARSKAEWETLEAFMGLLETLDITAGIADRAAVLQRVHGLDWGRSMVLATAHIHNLALVVDGDALPVNDPHVQRLPRPQLRAA